MQKINKNQHIIQEYYQNQYLVIKMKKNNFKINNTYLILIFLSLLQTACGSLKKEEKIILNNLLEDKSIYNQIFNYTYENFIDKYKSILISDEIISKEVFSKFNLDWENLYPINRLTLNKIYQKNENDKLFLSEYEKLYFEKELKTKDSIKNKWNSKDIVNEKYKLIHFFNPNKLDDFEFNYNKTKTIIPIFAFSKPILNKKKNISLIGFSVYSNESLENRNLALYLIILKKENGKWQFKGYETFDNSIM